ncbi:MAG: sigma-70 family RNA polymerase sigma factor [Lachnospiraceae bacterium]|nr:sigma-70 family RNA polymerase sigma factor [Lachnospiraceae bacterium]
MSDHNINKKINGEKQEIGDEELMELILSGDKEALGILLERHKSTVRKIINTNNYFVLGGDSDDILQEGMIGLVFAINSYDPGKGTRFVTHASTCIKNHIVDAIRKDRAGKNSVLNSAISLDSSENANRSGENPEPDILGLSLSAEDTVLGEDNARELSGKIDKALSPLEREIYELYLKGMKYTEISVVLNRDKKSVDNATRRMRKKIKTILQEYSVEG